MSEVAMTATCFKESKTDAEWRKSYRLNPPMDDRWEYVVVHSIAQPERETLWGTTTGVTDTLPGDESGDVVDWLPITIYRGSLENPDNQIRRAGYTVISEVPR